MFNRVKLLCLCLALSSPWTFAAPLTIEEIVTLKSVLAAKLSPDGQRVAYVLNVHRKPYVDDDGAPHRELHVTDLQGNSRGYVTGEVGVREVLWSADGGRLYYLAERDDDEHVALYSIPVDGGESTRVYAHDTDMTGMRLSSDGTRLAFRAVDPAPEQAEALADKGFKAVVYEESARFTGVWTLDLTADDAEAVAAELPGSASALEWAPDGQRYAVALAPTPLVDDSYVRRKLHIVEAATGRVLRELDHEGKLGAFAWSPDSRRVAFIGAEDVNDPLEGRVYVATVDGEQVENLTPDYAGHVHDIAWRDDDTLLYRGSRGLWVELATIDARDGMRTPPRLVEGQPIAREIDARQGIERVALIADTPMHPSEVYVWEPRDGYRRLTDSNPWLAERDLAAQEAVTYQARDGLELEGVLIRPLDERGGERYPVVLAIHGGPESHYSHGWMSSYTFPAQAMAAEGFAFFYPNYRASTGRGVAFSKLDHGDPAGREFDDIVDAKAYLVDIGLADPDRVGISGGSYGGYATLWGATALTEHYAAGVAFVGISDLVGKIGTGDIPHEMHLVHLRFWPWEDWQLARERSPIYHAGKSRTPLLILGGDADTRVDPSQSLSIYRHIKLQTDTPVRLVRYPGEGHGNARTAARLDYALRMRRWMSHYLQGPGGEPPPYELDHGARLKVSSDEDEE